MIKKDKLCEKEFALLTEKYKEEMFKIAYSYMKNKEDAFDLVGDAVYKAYLNRSKLKEPKYFKTWIIRILINTANSTLKKREREERFKGFFKQENKIRDREMEMDVKEAIHKLDKRSKNIIILKYYNGYTLQSISEILDCPLGTVKSSLNRTLKKLKISLGEDKYDYEGGVVLYERASGA